MARVLVVDDDADILVLVQMQLRHAGHTPVGAASGAEALAAIARDGAPDVAVVDIRMPGMNGYELVDELHAQGLRDLPVIFLSARTEPDGDARPGAAYLLKPYSVPDLLGEIENALSARR